MHRAAIFCVKFLPSVWIVLMVFVSQSCPVLGAEWFEGEWYTEFYCGEISPRVAHSGIRLGLAQTSDHIFQVSDGRSIWEVDASDGVSLKSIELPNILPKEIYGNERTVNIAWLRGCGGRTVYGLDNTAGFAFLLAEGKNTLLGKYYQDGAFGVGDDVYLLAGNTIAQVDSQGGLRYWFAGRWWADYEYIRGEADFVIGELCGVTREGDVILIESRQSGSYGRVFRVKRDGGSVEISVPIESSSFPWHANMGVVSGDYLYVCMAPIDQITPKAVYRISLLDGSGGFWAGSPGDWVDILAIAPSTAGGVVLMASVGGRSTGLFGVNEDGVVRSIGMLGHRFPFLSNVKSLDSERAYWVDNLKIYSFSMRDDGPCSLVAGNGTSAVFNSIDRIVRDKNGNLYILDGESLVIRKIDPSGVATTFAGSYLRALEGTGSPDGVGTQAYFGRVVRDYGQDKVLPPQDMVIDDDGFLYLADSALHIVRKVAPDATVTTVAGRLDEPGLLDAVGGDARFNNPTALAVGNGHVLYIADQSGGVLRSLAPDGLVRTLYSVPSGKITGLLWCESIGLLLVVDSQSIYRYEDGLVQLLNISAPPGGIQALFDGGLGTLYISPDSRWGVTRRALYRCVPQPVVVGPPAVSGSTGRPMRYGVATSVSLAGNYAWATGFIWQRQDRDGVWVDLDEGAFFKGVNTAELTVCWSDPQIQHLVIRCLVKCGNLQVGSEVVSLALSTPTLLASPVDANCLSGYSCGFSADIYQTQSFTPWANEFHINWQISKDGGGTWMTLGKDLDEPYVYASGAGVTIGCVAPAMDGWLFRVQCGDSSKTFTSEPAALHVRVPNSLSYSFGSTPLNDALPSGSDLFLRFVGENGFIYEFPKYEIRGLLSKDSLSKFTITGKCVDSWVMPSIDDVLVSRDGAVWIFGSSIIYEALPSGRLRKVYEGYSGPSIGAPSCLAADGLYFISGTSSRRISRITKDGKFEDVVGNGDLFAEVREGRGRLASIPDGINSLVLAGDGNIYFSDKYSIWRLTADGRAVIISNPRRDSGYCDGTAMDARYNLIVGMFAGADGFLYVAEAGFGDHVRPLRRVALDGSVCAVAGNYTMGERPSWPDGAGAVRVKADGSVIFASGLMASLKQPGQISNMRATMQGFGLRRYRINQTELRYDCIVEAAGTFSITINAESQGSLRYQWKQWTDTGWQDVQDGLGVSGTNTAALRLSPITDAMKGLILTCEIDAGYSKVLSEVFKIAEVVHSDDAPQPPLIISQPQSITVQPDESAFVAFTVLTGCTAYSPNEEFQWQYSSDSGNTWQEVVNNHDYRGAFYDHGAFGELRIYGATAAMNGWQYRCVINNRIAAPVVSEPATLTVIGSQFAALSARAPAGTGDQTLILGFVFSGGGKPTLVRGVGPGLSKTVSGYMKDPQLRLFTGNGVEVASNNDWAGGADLSLAFAKTGAAALSPNSKDAALLMGLDLPIYTAHVSGTGGSTGIALAEVYDANLDDKAKRLMALAVRNQVGLGDDILIAGFVVSGSGQKRVIVRGVGPGLSATVSSYLRDPYLQVWKLNTETGAWALAGENDNWDHTATTAALFQSSGMSELANDSKDAAMVLTLDPGIYTAQVSGVAATTGVGLVEIYEAK